jgi:hypothetical protein
MKDLLRGNEQQSRADGLDIARRHSPISTAGPAEPHRTSSAEGCVRIQAAGPSFVLLVGASPVPDLFAFCHDVRPGISPSSRPSPDAHAQNKKLGILSTLCYVPSLSQACQGFRRSCRWTTSPPLIDPCRFESRASVSSLASLFFPADPDEALVVSTVFGTGCI